MPWILLTLLALQTPTPLESLGERRERLSTIALAYQLEVDLAVMTGRFPGHERRLWTAAALATGYRESGFALSVHRGERLGDAGRSTCLHQINRGNPGAHSPHPWTSLAGITLSATRRCIRAGLQSLANMRAHCARRVPPRELLAATLSAYLSGRSCRVSPEGKTRLALTERILGGTLPGRRERTRERSNPGESLVRVLLE